MSSQNLLNLGTGVHFPDLKPNFYDNLNKIKLYLNVSTKAKFNAI